MKPLVLIVALWLLLTTGISFAADFKTADEAILSIGTAASTPKELIDAIDWLADNMEELISDQRQRALDALVRASHSKDQDVRRHAWKKVFDSVVGPRSGLSVKQEGEFSFRTALFRRGDDHWMPAETLVALESGDAERRKAALRSFAQSFNPPKARNAAGDAYAHAFGAYIADVDRREADCRGSTLTIIEKMGIVDTTVPVLIRAVASDDTEAKATARRLCPSAELGKDFEIAHALADALIDPDAAYAAAAAKLLPAKLDKKVKEILALVVADAADKLDLKPVELLKTFRVEKTIFAAEIERRLHYQEKPLALLEAARRASINEVLDEEAVSGLNHAILKLLFDEDPSIGTAAAALLTAPKIRSRAFDDLIKTIEGGRVMVPEIISTFAPDPAAMERRLIPSLKSDFPEVRRAAIVALSATGINENAVRDLVAPALRSRDRDTRIAAAQAIGSPYARARVRVPDLLHDAGAPVLSTRELAVRQLDELNIESKPITRALVVATESGDFAARQGLLTALESANFSAQDALTVLKNSASDQNRDAIERAYARAALRRLQQGEPNRKPAESGGKR